MFEDVVLNPAISGIKLNETSLNLTVGKTSTLSVSAQPTTADISGQKITWKSANKSVATVSSKGVVTAIGAGTTKITATVLGYTAECTVTVAEPISLNLSETAITLPKQQIKKLTATLEGASKDTTITWSSSNEEVATVDENGIVTALKFGTATITASVERKITETFSMAAATMCRVTVSGQLGDVDKDGNITAYDAYKALVASADYSIDSEIEEQIILTSDVNKNGVPEAEDAYKILQYSAGLIDKF